MISFRKLILMVSLATLLLPLVGNAGSNDDPKCLHNKLSSLISEESDHNHEGFAEQELIWGKWDCKSCGHKGISAEPKPGQKITTCPFCGAPMDMKKQEFYLDNEIDKSTGEILNPNVADTEEEIKIAQGGEDWNCAFCNSRNRNLFPSCETCGANRFAEKILKEPTIRKEEMQPSSAAAIKPVVPHENLSPAIEEMPKNSKFPRIDPQKAKIGGGIAAGTAIVGGGLYWALSTRVVDGVVSHTDWKKTVNRETFTRVSLRNWRDQIPGTRPVMPVNGSGENAGSENIRNCSQEFFMTDHYVCGTEERCHTEQESYTCGTEQYCQTKTRRVQSGQSCQKSCTNSSNKNGSFTQNCYNNCTPTYRSESYEDCGTRTKTCTRPKRVCETVNKYCDRPIYKDKCDFESYEWKSSGSNSTNGENPGRDIQTLKWPEMKLGPLDRILREENYEIELEYKDGKKVLHDTEKMKSESEYLSWHKGDPVLIDLRNVGGVARFRHNPKKGASADY